MPDRPLRRAARAAVVLALAVTLLSLGALGLNRFGCAVGESDSCPGSDVRADLHARVFTLDGRSAGASVVRVEPRTGDGLTLTADARGRLCVREPEGQWVTLRVGRTGPPAGPVDPRFRDPAVLRRLRAEHRDSRPPVAIVLPEARRPVEAGLDASGTVESRPADRAATCSGGLAALPWTDFRDASGSWQPALIVALALLALVAAPLVWLTVLRHPRAGLAHALVVVACAAMAAASVAPWSA